MTIKSSLLLLVGLSLSAPAWAQTATPTNLSAPAPAISAPAAIPPPSLASSLADVSVSQAADGTDTIKLKFTGQSHHVDLQQLPTKVVLDLGAATIDPMLLQKSLPNAIRLVPKGPTSTTKVEIALGKPATAQAYQTSSAYVLDLSPVAPQTKSSTVPAKKYVGRPISFNFQDVPVRTVLQLIAEESNLNLVVSDNVQGNVTLRLVNVPWDQALDIVLQSKGLDQRRTDKVIWVGPQEEIAKVEQAKEDARIAMDNRVDLQTAYIPVNYHSASAIYKSLTEAKGIGGSNTQTQGAETENSFLSSRGRIVVDERTNTLIISDIPKKIQQLKELVSVIDRPVDQVLIEARLVIATDSFARDLGARFGIFGQHQYGDNTATVGSSIAGNRAGSPGLNVNLPAGTFTNSPAGSLAYTLLGKNFSLDLELTAMQEQNQGEIISNPRLITSNQREAVIRQGKEVGYVTITGGTAGTAATPNVQFKEALLELKVTPTITNDNRVFLNLNVKKDEIDQYLDLGDYGAVPQISKREINTAVLVEDGQTVVIGGVYEFNDRNSISKVPFLGDIPFVGNLFKKRGRSKGKAELLIFVTPHTMLVGHANVNSVLANGQP